MLAHSSQHQTKEPTTTASGTGLEEREIVLLALDRAFGTRAGLLMGQQKVAISGDERVKAIVLLWVSIDDAAIGRIRAAVGEKGTRGKRRGFGGSSQRAAPLDTQATTAEASVFHWTIGGTDRDAIFEAQGASISQVVRVARIEGNDESHTPTGSGQTEVTEGIMCGIQGNSLDRETEDFSCMVQDGKSVDGIVAVAVGNGDDQGELTAMLEGVGGEFVEAVSIDPTFAVTIPAPESQGVKIGTVAGAVFFRLFTPIVTGAELLAASVSPGGEFAAITSDEKVVQVDEAKFPGSGDEARKEDGVEDTLIRIERREITIAFEGSSQRKRRGITSQDAINQAVNDVLVRS